MTAACSADAERQQIIGQFHHEKSGKFIAERQQIIEQFHHEKSGKFIVSSVRNTWLRSSVRTIIIYFILFYFIAFHVFFGALYSLDQITERVTSIRDGLHHQPTGWSVRCHAPMFAPTPSYLCKHAPVRPATRLAYIPGRPT